MHVVSDIRHARGGAKFIQEVAGNIEKIVPE